MQSPEWAAFDFEGIDALIKGQILWIHGLSRPKTMSSWLLFPDIQRTPFLQTLPMQVNSVVLRTDAERGNRLSLYKVRPIEASGAKALAKLPSTLRALGG